MELPIQLKFYKKIDLYQEYKFNEKRYLNSKFPTWFIEKKILKWVISNHYHLGSPIKYDQVVRDVLNNNDPKNEGLHAMSSLIQRNFAEKTEDVVNLTYPSEMRITKEGFLMAEVVYEIESKESVEFRYIFFYCLVWITVFAGSVIVINNAIKVVYPIIKNIIPKIFFIN